MQFFMVLMVNGPPGSQGLCGWNFTTSPRLLLSHWSDATETPRGSCWSISCYTILLYCLLIYFIFSAPRTCRVALMPQHCVYLLFECSCSCLRAKSCDYKHNKKAVFTKDFWTVKTFWKMLVCFENIWIKTLVCYMRLVIGQVCLPLTSLFCFWSYCH